MRGVFEWRAFGAQEGYSLNAHSASSFTCGKIHLPTLRVAAVAAKVGHYIRFVTPHVLRGLVVHPLWGCKEILMEIVGVPYGGLIWGWLSSVARKTSGVFHNLLQEMVMKTTAILASALLMSVSIPALAGDWKGLSETERNVKIQEKFTGLDSNKDGALSKDEFTADSRMSGTDFDDADLNNDDALSTTELKAFKEAKWMDKSQATNSNERMNNDGSRTSH